jgi:hypothetical protein
MLLPTVSRLISTGYKHPSGALDRIYIVRVCNVLHGLKYVVDLRLMVWILFELVNIYIHLSGP